MFKNYFKIAWRNLFKNKLHTAINIGGLTIGFTIGIAVLLVVYQQFSYDNFHANGKKLYQAYYYFNKKTGAETSSSFGFPAAPIFKAEAPAIDKTSRFMYGGNKVVYKEKELEIPVMLVDADFLSMFTFPVIKGSKTNALQNLTDVVITEDAATKIFGNEDPIGKAIKTSAGGVLQAMTVSAVVKNVPVNSTIKFEILTRLENSADYAKAKNDWDNQHHPVYVMLKEGATPQQAEEQLRAINQKYVPYWYDNLKKEGAIPDKQGNILGTRLLSFDKLHFTPGINNHATNKIQIYTLMAVGLMIILIACFNFININLATAFTRSREMGVRKCLGAAKTKLFLQLWIESFLVCCIAFLLSMALVNILMHTLKNIAKVNSLFTIIRQPDFLGLTVALLVLVSFIAGGYPARVMAGFKVVETLKGKVSLKRKSILRDTLIITQFVIACIMISCTYIIYSQFQYLQKADLGFNKEALISVPLHNPDKGRETINKLRTRLASDPHILSITGSNINAGRGMDGAVSKISISFDYKSNPIKTNMASADYDYLKTLGIPLLEGRDFDKSYATDTLNNMLVSESAAKQFHEKDLVGKSIPLDSGARPMRIVGIFPDFHMYSMHETIQPLMITMNKQEGINYCFIKVSSQNLLTSMESIKKEMALLEPGREFRGSFVDENIRNWYSDERAMSFSFSMAALIAIVLSCSGLLAIVLLIIQQRIKEIGVRKVLGATVQNISVMLSKDFLKLVLIAVLIATPVSWWVLNQWLQSFPYRITIQWWMLALVACVAFIIAIITISLNTIRVARQNPVRALRSE
jgi:putative ABC transport system permease protein